MATSTVYVWKQQLQIAFKLVDSNCSILIMSLALEFLIFKTIFKKTQFTQSNFVFTIN